MIFWLSLAAPLFFLVISIILGILTPNYRNSRDEISYLIYGPYGKLQTANFLGSGLLTLVLALTLSSPVDNSLRGLSFVQTAVWALGMSFILLRVFPTQQKGHKTFISIVHKIVFVISVLAQGTLQLLFAVQNPKSLIITYSFVSGTIVILGLPTMLFWKSKRGLVQRILVGAILLWVTVASFLVYD